MPQKSRDWCRNGNGSDFLMKRTESVSWLRSIACACSPTAPTSSTRNHGTTPRSLSCSLSSRMSSCAAKRKWSCSASGSGVPSKKREGLLSTFRESAACRIFLSTDAGGVGLNLQSASIVVNLDLPWNPAVLEQRIGRVYRHGQSKPVSVINLISRGSIEERMQAVLKFKSSLFSGVFDGGSDEVMMGESTFKRFMHDVEEIAHPPKAVHSTNDFGGRHSGRERVVQAKEIAAAVISSTLAEEPLLKAPVKKEDEAISLALSVGDANKSIIAAAFRAFGILFRRWF